MVKLEFQPQDLDTVMRALGKLPFEDVYRVIANINIQLSQTGASENKVDKEVNTG